jgi:adenosylmethionine-8-amino-7-oxononanoate aminotransferase
MTISKSDQQYIWHPFTQMKTAKIPIAIVRGEGSLLFDENNKSYIDAISSWWVNLHGHAHPYIRKKMDEQHQKLAHVMFAGFTHQSATNLCEQLSTVLPKNQSKFFFSGDGSSAVEISLKMAIQFWRNKGIKKQKILALEGGYHGETFGAMSAGAKSIFTAHFQDYLFEVTHLPFPSEKNCLIELEKELQGGDVAAFIFEPLVQGANGMKMYDSNILNKMIALCKKYKTLTIADEVMTGFGRTGTFFACNQLNQNVDFICLSKGLSGGTLPISLTTCTQEVYNSFLGNDMSTAFLHGHSYTGNALGCAAAIASLELLKKESCQAKIKSIINNHEQFVSKIKHFDFIKDIRQTGTILAIELHNKNNSYTSSIKDEMYNFFLEKGINLRPLGNVLYIMPPYCITDQELIYIYDNINLFFKSLKKVSLT